MKSSILGRTGQWWKVIIGAIALLVGSIAPLFESTGISVMAGTVLAVVGYGFTVALTRCPNCGTRWFWKALLDGGLYRPLFTRPDCPVCGQEY